MLKVDDYVIGRKTKRYGRIKEIKDGKAILTRHGYKGRIKKDLKDLELDTNGAHWGEAV